MIPDYRVTTRSLSSSSVYTNSPQNKSPNNQYYERTPIRDKTNGVMLAVFNHQRKANQNEQIQIVDKIKTCTSLNSAINIVHEHQHVVTPNILAQLIEKSTLEESNILYEAAPLLSKKKAALIAYFTKISKNGFITQELFDRAAKALDSILKQSELDDKFRLSDANIGFFLDKICRPAMKNRFNNVIEYAQKTIDYAQKNDLELNDNACFVFSLFLEGIRQGHEDPDSIFQQAKIIYSYVKNPSTKLQVSFFNLSHLVLLAGEKAIKECISNNQHNKAIEIFEKYRKAFEWSDRNIIQLKNLSIYSYINTCSNIFKLGHSHALLDAANVYKNTFGKDITPYTNNKFLSMCADAEFSNFNKDERPDIFWNAYESFKLVQENNSCDVKPIKSFLVVCAKVVDESISVALKKAQEALFYALDLNMMDGEVVDMFFEVYEKALENDGVGSLIILGNIFKSPELRKEYSIISRFLNMIIKHSWRVEIDDHELRNEIFEIAKRAFFSSPVYDRSIVYDYITACRNLMSPNRPEIFNSILEAFERASDSKLVNHEICNSFIYACLMRDEYGLAKIAIRKNRDCIPQIVHKETDYKSIVDVHGLGHGIALLALADYDYRNWTKGR